MGVKRSRQGGLSQIVLVIVGGPKKSKTTVDVVKVPKGEEYCLLSSGMCLLIKAQLLHGSREYDEIRPKQKVLRSSEGSGR